MELVYLASCFINGIFIWFASISLTGLKIYLKWYTAGKALKFKSKMNTKYWSEQRKWTLASYTLEQNATHVLYILYVCNIWCGM